MEKTKNVISLWQCAQFYCINIVKNEVKIEFKTWCPIFEIILSLSDDKMLWSNQEKTENKQFLSIKMDKEFWKIDIDLYCVKNIYMESANRGNSKLFGN